MRLGTLFLTAATLAAQAPRGLPWMVAPQPPWKTTLAAPQNPPVPVPAPNTPETGPIRVDLSGDGTLKISDARGVVRLRLGLPGRPLRIWRDAGIPITLAESPYQFPAETPLSKGLGNLPLEGPDFRIALGGLLWILEDGERVLTVVHPATYQVVYLPLPLGQNLDVLMYPDRLDLCENSPSLEERQEAPCWSIPWLGLLPQFMRLSQAPPAGKQGTALEPFPKD